MGVEAKYGMVLSSTQSPVEGGELNDGSQLSITATASLPVNESLSFYLQAQLYQITITYAGASEHIDTLTEPGETFSYTASEEDNQLSSVNLGIHWQL